MSKLNLPHGRVFSLVLFMWGVCVRQVLFFSLNNEFISEGTWVLHFLSGKIFLFLPHVFRYVSLYVIYLRRVTVSFLTPFVGLNSNSESVFSVYVCEEFLISASPYLLCLLLEAKPRRFEVSTLLPALHIWFHFWFHRCLFYFWRLLCLKKLFPFHVSSVIEICLICRDCLKE